MIHTRVSTPRASSSRVARRAVAALAAVALGASVVLTGPAAALAATSDEISSQLDTAREKLDSLTHQLEIAQAVVDDTEMQLSDTQDRITELEGQIEETAEELGVARDALSDHVSDFYKNGGTLSLTELVLSSSSFDELTSNIYYANKVVDAENQQIQSVKDLQGQLESQQGELSQQEGQLQELLAGQQEEADNLAAAQSEAQSYVNGLSTELQEALAAERAAAAEEQRRLAEEAAAQQRAEEEAQQQAQQNQQQGGSESSGSPVGGDSTPSGSNGGGGTSGGGSSTGGGSTSGGGSSSGGTVSGGSGSLSSAQRSTIVAAAKSQLGVAYILGACNPGVAMDCSGLSSYAYAQAGISIPHQSGRQYRMVVNAGNLKTSASSLVAGDLVFYQSGGAIYHVAVYIGNNMVCHANGYGSGTVISSIFLDSGFCGGGSPV